MAMSSIHWVKLITAVLAASCLFLPGLKLPAQNITWENLYSNDGGALFSVKTDVAGNILTAGRSDTFSTGGIVQRSMTLKLDKNGSTLWRSPFFDGYGWAAGTVTHDLALAGDAGSSVITGYSIFDVPGDAGGLFLRKYDPAGQVLWDQRYGFPYHVVNGGSISKTMDGGYIIAGTYDTCLFLMKTNMDGDSAWSRYYPCFQPYFDELGIWSRFFGKIIETDDGGYLLCYTSKLPVLSMSVIKFTSGGDTVWTKYYNPGQWSFGNSIVQTTDGNYLACGSQFNQYVSDAKLVMIDATGNITWEKEYDKFGYSDEFTSLVMDQEGDFYAAGFTTAGNYSYKNFAWAVKINPSGDTLWTRVDGEGTYGTSETLYDIDTTGDGGIVVCGSSGSLLFIARLDSGGGGFVGIHEAKPARSDKVRIFVTDQAVTIDFSQTNGTFINAGITITDICGKSLYSWNATGSGLTSFSIGNLNSGVYFLCIEDSNHREVEKFIKR